MVSHCGWNLGFSLMTRDDKDFWMCFWLYVCCLLWHVSKSFPPFWNMAVCLIIDMQEFFRYFRYNRFVSYKLQVFSLILWLFVYLIICNIINVLLWTLLPREGGFVPLQELWDDDGFIMPAYELVHWLLESSPELGIRQNELRHVTLSQK